MEFDSSNRINLVSLTNIDIWRSYGQKFSKNTNIRFLAIWAEIFCGNLGNYYLSIAGEISMLCCSVPDFDFLGPYWREKGRGRRIRVWGLKICPKS